MIPDDIDAHFSTQRQRNAARREAHKDWPSHAGVIYHPDGRVQRFPENVPVKRLSTKGYCKYCYTEHREWWLMDQNDYLVSDLTIVLCGRCEHTSGAEYAFEEDGLEEARKCVNDIERMEGMRKDAKESRTIVEKLKRKLHKEGETEDGTH